MTVQYVDKNRGEGEGEGERAQLAFVALMTSNCCTELQSTEPNMLLKMWMILFFFSLFFTVSKEDSTIAILDIYYTKATESREVAYNGNDIIC